MTTETELIEGQIENILFDAKEGDLINIPKRIDTIIILAREQGRKEAEIKFLKEDIKWLQSTLDTGHIQEPNAWVIEGRISKRQELLEKLQEKK